MRIGVGVVGVLILLIGAVFAGQGLGYIRGSVMTNDIKWFWIGVAMVILGLVMGAWSFLSRQRSHT